MHAHFSTNTLPTHHAPPPPPTTFSPLLDISIYIYILMRHVCEGFVSLTRVLSRNFCLGGKLRRGHSPRCQTSGGSRGSLNFRSPETQFRAIKGSFFLKNTVRCTSCTMWPVIFTAHYHITANFSTTIFT